MRIFYVITKSETGGAQTHIYQLSNYFISKGDKVAVMAHPGGWLEKELKRIGAVFYPNIFLSNSINPVKDIQAIATIKKAVKDFKPDLISGHSSKAGFLARLAIRNKIPTIFTAHGWGFTEGVPFLRKYLVIFLEKLAAKYCLKIICVSNFDKNLALRYKIAPLKKLTVIHNGVEINGQERAREKIQPKQQIRIVFVGRLAQPKEPLMLLESFNNLPPKLKGIARIDIIGDGPKRKEVEEFIKKNKLKEKAKLLGNLPRGKVFEVLKKSDIFVLTSKWEGFPRSILEAMSCGLAVIASDVGGVREAVDNSCGILVKRNETEGLRQALIKLIENPLLTRKMGEKSRQKAEGEFSLHKMLTATEKIYEQVLTNQKKIGLSLK